MFTMQTVNVVMNGINVTFGLKMEWEKISVGAGQEGRRRCDGRIE